MIAPAYSMDAAPTVYEASLAASGARASAMAHTFIHTMDASSSHPLRPEKFADYPTSASPSTAALLDASESASNNRIETSTAAIGLENFPQTNRRSSNASNGISSTGSRNADSRARLARVAFASGWVFLAIALFCLAQSFSVVPADPQRRWRPAARAHS
jgi:hypothetical protein